MGRYRPPRKRGSPYITPEGEAALREELHQLWKVERPQVTASVHEAAKNGDRSENGDYIYGKRRLREIDTRGKRVREQWEKDASERRVKLSKTLSRARVDMIELSADEEASGPVMRFFRRRELRYAGRIS